MFKFLTEQTVTTGEPNWLFILVNAGAALALGVALLIL